MQGEYAVTLRRQRGRQVRELAWKVLVDEENVHRSGGSRSLDLATPGATACGLDGTA